MFAAAFKPFGDIAGHAGALYGLVQLGGGALFGAILSGISETSQLPLAIMMIMSAVCAGLSLLCVKGSGS